jgi:hypothetical protein
MRIRLMSMYCRDTRAAAHDTKPRPVQIMAPSTAAAAYARKRTLAALADNGCCQNHHLCSFSAVPVLASPHLAFTQHDKATLKLSKHCLKPFPLAHMTCRTPCLCLQACKHGHHRTGTHGLHRLTNSDCPPNCTSCCLLSAYLVPVVFRAFLNNLLSFSPYPHAAAAAAQDPQTDPGPPPRAPSTPLPVPHKMQELHLAT